MSRSAPEPASSSSSQFLLLKPQLSPHHPLVKLAEAIDWSYFEQAFQSQIAGDIGRPQLPTRLLVGLHYLKAMYDERDESVVRQSYVRLGKRALLQQSRYAAARQGRRAQKQTQKLRTYLGRVIRDMERKLSVPQKPSQPFWKVQNRFTNSTNKIRTNVTAFMRQKWNVLPKAKQTRSMNLAAK